MRMKWNLFDRQSTKSGIKILLNFVIFLLAINTIMFLIHKVNPETKIDRNHVFDVANRVREYVFSSEKYGVNSFYTTNDLIYNSKKSSFKHILNTHVDEGRYFYDVRNKQSEIRIDWQIDVESNLVIKEIYLKKGDSQKILFQITDKKDSN